MTGAALFLSTLCCAALLAGCGSGGKAATTHAPPSMTRADVRKIKAAVRRDPYTREVAAGSHLRVAEVIPWLSEGGRELIGGLAHVYLKPAVDLEDQKLPATISPNHTAPPGTPTLYRFIRMSATDVSEIEVSVRLADARIVQIEPSGSGYRVTKAELIGPAPTDPAYAPEPGY